MELSVYPWGLVPVVNSWARFLLLAFSKNAAPVVCPVFLTRVVAACASAGGGVCMRAKPMMAISRVASMVIVAHLRTKSARERNGAEGSGGWALGVLLVVLVLAGVPVFIVAPAGMLVSG